MYLKNLEIIGFKSFADKTRLEFEPGMTAIVGPNGCGKSNVADALRWVLGEQSAKALRGSKMEDCIFNGTDSRKPLGMAEVSVTFTDCEGVLNTEFHEVTVTRRVFRSGEGQYFMNKVPCRLKDIQRLFMDTGIGTSSYSMMEQGRIDAILSARPEDRRTIFEEASGITKFKADKKEAIRKLEHTEANLLRLADVVREVKRQIGSLQRQAGKARRYQVLQAELRKLDLFLTRQRLETADHEITETEARLAQLSGQQDRMHQEVREIDQKSAGERDALMAAEREIGTMLEAGVQARSRLDHTREMIEMNRQRIAEYRVLSERDTQEIDQTARQIEEQRRVQTEQSTQIDAARQAKTASEQEWRAAAAHLDQHHDQVERLRGTIQSLREEALEVESLSSKMQNQIIELEARERSTIIQRERHAAEKAQLARVVENFGVRQQHILDELAGLRTQVATDQQQLAGLESQRVAKLQALDDSRRENAGLDREAAALNARLDVLQERDANDDGFSAGARQVLRRSAELGLNSEDVVGTLAASLEAEPAYRVALETALRAWMDAVIVRDSATARAIAERLQQGALGAARLLAAELTAASAVPVAAGGADRLVDHVQCAVPVRALLESLIGNVRVVGELADIPHPVPAPLAYVTRQGVLVTHQGLVEVWMPDNESAAPLARRRFLLEGREGLSSLEARATESRDRAAILAAELASAERDIQSQRLRYDESRRALAQKEGEQQIVAREAQEAAQRLETVSWELEDLGRQDQTGHAERQAIGTRLQQLQEQRRQLTVDVAAQTQSLRQMEEAQSSMQATVTDHRIRHEGLNQKVEHLGAQHASTLSRLQDLEAAREGRARGVRAYAESMTKLSESVQHAESQLAPMEAAVVENRRRTEALQAQRDEQTRTIRATEALLANKRAVLDDLRETRSATDIQLTECRMRRQNQMERVSADYGITSDQLAAEPNPEWPEGQPPLDTLDTSVAELRTKIEAMGPVNLVAIEEYNELEERHAFLTTQEQDLVSAKDQLMEMIRKINRTTSEMFSTTFQQVNENFQKTFEKIFGGGSAKLVLVNEEDVLECGIEIIARPPGKRLQNVSLLSGGERTMTAVALLFSIYMIKPSPFCMLDELDAALDEANIGRFVSILQGFINQSQFVIITHNRQTIAAADILYGVTMPEKGISRIVSMRFNHREKPPAVAAAAPVPAAT